MYYGSNYKVSFPVDASTERWDNYRPNYERNIPNYAHQVGAGKYSLTKPVLKDGTKRNYFKILLTLMDGPLSKKQMLRKAGYGARSEWRGYLSALFMVLTACDLIRYDRKSNTYSYGDSFGEWHRLHVK